MNIRRNKDATMVVYCLSRYKKSLRLNAFMILLIFGAFVPVMFPGTASCKMLGREFMSTFIDEVMAYLKFDASQKEALLKGKIIFTGIPELEKTEKMVAVAGVMMVIRRPVAEVIDACMDGETFRQYSEILASKPIVRRAPAESDFPGIGYSAEEMPEVRKLINVKPGFEFNLSREEIARFQTIDPKDSKANEKASALYRNLLFDRHRSHLSQGLDGIPSYDRGGKRRSSPGQELKDAIESAWVLKKYFPDFYSAVLNYPNNGIEGARHRFYWIKEVLDKRPAFVLSHHMLLVRGGVALACDIQFYVGFSYNSMLTLIGAVSYEGGTLVFCSNRTSSDKVTGFSGRIKKAFGRKIISELLAKHFEKVRTSLERRNERP
jgi:hypothetical protein